MLFSIWVLFSVCGGAVAFANKTFKQWTGHNNTSNVGDFASALWLDVRDGCWRECKQDHVHQFKEIVQYVTYHQIISLVELYCNCWFSAVIFKLEVVNYLFSEGPPVDIYVHSCITFALFKF